MTLHRQAVRALLLTPNDEVLLIRIRRPDGGQGFWIAPGGGLEPGEAPDDGLRRELREELGLAELAIGPLVWRRRHTFTWNGRRISQKEDYRIVHVDRFEPIMTDEVEAASMDGFRWWPIADLDKAVEPLTPRSLAAILRRYLAEGAPQAPLVEEVLVD